MKETEIAGEYLERMPRLTLKRRPALRERAQHPWIFSNEIAEIPRKFTKLEPGALVEVLDCHGNFLGSGLFHPNSLIAVRVLSWKEGEKIGADFFARKIRKALAWREKVYGRGTGAEQTYRAVFGESDGLPGFILDRFENTWVMQFHSVGMWNRRGELVKALESALDSLGDSGALKCVVARTDVQSRTLENMEKVSEVIAGELPASGAWAVENNLRYPVDVVGGQKTGFYFDQRENRRAFYQMIASSVRVNPGLRVADIYSHVGAWGLAALAAGAEHVTFIDASEPALNVVREMVKNNGWQERAEFICGDAKEIMPKLQPKQFDFIAFDPPSFIPNKKSIVPGMRAYALQNVMAARLLRESGILATSSCSHHCLEEKFEETISHALRKEKSQPKIVFRGGAAFDHPIRPGMPESKYLKCFFYQI